jgi:hypothetical protein
MSQPRVSVTRPGLNHAHGAPVDSSFLGEQVLAILLWGPFRRSSEVKLWKGGHSILPATRALDCTALCALVNVASCMTHNPFRGHSCDGAKIGN